jgi:pyrimidine operon attenuation protein/uracil phosphoribosyltransferase
MTLRTLLEADDVRRAITRMAHELVEHDPDAERLVLLGIPTRGAVLARRLGEQMTRIAGREVPVGVLDVTLYRDDLAGQPTRPTTRTEVPVDLDGATVVLADDVLYSGRTVRAALDAITAFGRPAAVRLAVLVDRGHRELPIRPDAVGRNLPSAKSERVRVRLAEIDGEDAVTIDDGSADA